jgi:hypothetical protein
LFFLVGIGLSFSCSTDPTDVPRGEFEKGVLILNEGAFGANDGEVYHYDSQTGEVQQDIFEKVNHRPFAGLIQDMVAHAENFYIVANTGKVEVVRSSDFQSLGAVSGNGLENCRHLAVAGDKLFISDWGPYDNTWANPDSFLAVVDSPEGGSVSNKISVPSRPEGLFVVNGKILTACSAAGVFAVIDSEKEELESIVPVDGAPFSFFEYETGIYLYARTDETIYFHRVNPTDFSVLNTVEIALSNTIYNGNFALGENGEVYVITSGGPSDKVAVVSLTSGDIINEAFYSGSDFYGLGYHKSEKTLYIGEHNGWQGNVYVKKINDVG